MIRFALLMTCSLMIANGGNAADRELPSESLPAGKERPAVEQEFYLPLAPVPPLADQSPTFPLRKRFESVVDWMETAQRRAVEWGLLPESPR